MAGGDGAGCAVLVCGIGRLLTPSARAIERVEGLSDSTRSGRFDVNSSGRIHGDASLLMLLSWVYHVPPQRVVGPESLAIGFWLDAAVLSVAAKKGTNLAAMAVTGPRPSNWSLSLLSGVLFGTARSLSRARRCWARRSEPLTARTVLR